MNTTMFLNGIQQSAGAHILLDRLLWAAVEMTLLAALVWTGLRFFRGLSPRARALLWLLVLVKPLVALAVGAPVPVFRVPVVQQFPVFESVVAQTPPTPSSHTHTGPTHAETVPEPVNAPIQDAPQAPTLSEMADVAPLPSVESASSVPEVAVTPHYAFPDLPGVLVVAWAASVFLLAFYRGMEYVRLHRIVQHGETPATALMETYSALAGGLGAKRPPRLRITNAIESPALAGAVRPVILLPSWMSDDAHQAALSWALRHELMHWKHGDTLANLLRQAAQVLFFFHPLVWWAGNRWEEAAELACDRALIHTSDEAHEYARNLYDVLAQLHGQRERSLAGGLFATRTQVGKRIAALLANPLRHPARLGAGVMLALVLIAATSLMVGGTFSIAALEAERNTETSGDTAVVVPEVHARAMISIGGVIVDETDSPVEGARILLGYDDEDSLVARKGVEAITDASGRWRAEIPEGLFRITWRVQHPEYVLSHISSHRAVSDSMKAGTMRHVLRCMGMRVDGEVTNVQGSPIPDAIVCAFSDPNERVDDIEVFRSRVAEGSVEYAVLTGVDGRFDITLASQKERIFQNSAVFVLADGYAPTAFVAYQDGESHHVVLDEGATWRGVVHDVSGQPVAAADVRGYEWHIPDVFGKIPVKYLSTHTDTQGAFIIHRLPTTGQIDFYIHHDAFFACHVVGPDSPDTDEMTYTLYSARPLRGRVVDADTGAPVTDFSVKLWFSREDAPITMLQPTHWQEFSMPDGIFSLNFRPTLNETSKGIAVQVIADEYNLLVVDPVYVPDINEVPLTFALSKDKPIQGYVVNEAGTPVEDVQVVLAAHPQEVVQITGHTVSLDAFTHSARNTAYTDADGQFQLQADTRAHLLLIALHRDGWNVLPYADHKPEAPLVLSRWCRLEGQVSMEHRPRPHEPVRIYVDAALPEEWNIDRLSNAFQFFYDVETDETGRFSVDYMPALPLRVSEGRPNGLSHSRSVTPHPGETIQVDFYGGHRGTVRGKLSWEFPQDPTEASVIPWNSVQRFFFSARLINADASEAEKERRFVPFVWEDGSFLLDALPVGVYELSASVFPLPVSLGYPNNRMIARMTHAFSIPPDQDVPLDLGTLGFEPVPQQPEQTAPEIEDATMERDD